MVLSSKLSQELTSVAFIGRGPFRFAAGHRIARWEFSCFFSKAPVKFWHSRESLESRHDHFFHVMSNLSPPNYILFKHYLFSLDDTVIRHTINQSINNTRKDICSLYLVNWINYFKGHRIYVYQYKRFPLSVTLNQEVNCNPSRTWQQLGKDSLMF